MKNFLLIAVVVLLTAEGNSQRIRLGVIAGGHNNIFKIITKGQFDNSTIFTGPGIHGGILVDIPTSTQFFLQPQLLYVSKGGVTEGKSGFRFNTIDLSLNCNWRFQDFFIGIGPNFSYSVRGRIIENGKGVNLYSDVASQFLVKAKRLEIGPNFRMGYYFPGRLMLEASYSVGLSNIFDEVSPQAPKVDANNSFFGISVGYLLRTAK